MPVDPGGIGRERRYYLQVCGLDNSSYADRWHATILQGLQGKASPVETGFRTVMRPEQLCDKSEHGEPSCLQALEFGKSDFAEKRPVTHRPAELFF
jgi:hypothetical protein